ncbi:MAG TPA: anaerobic sulfatase maturase [bacterium]|nr:anaerobic sulfatase maturase [bacterium]HEX67728.1 anaerobic sulfatase maturase [bacterium]
MSFQLLLKPSGPDCNSNCTYCFYRRVSEIFPPPPHRMTREVLETIVRQYLQLQFPVSVFSWQGGEPTLMGLDFFREVVRLQMRYGSNGQVVCNGLQTNGLLIEGEWCRFLSKFKFLVGLSIDGPEEIHDFYRGKGTHKRVMQTAKLLKDYGVEFNVLVVLTDKSVGKTKEIFEFFLENDLRFLQFIPCMEVGERGIQPFSISPEGYRDFLLELFDLWWKVKEKVSVRMFDALLEKILLGKVQSFCPFAPRCGSYLVVEHDGSCYPCDFYVRKETYLGNVMETHLAEIYRSSLLQRFSWKKSFLPPECDTCPYKDYCYGGCQKDRVDRKGKPSTKTIYCLSYKSFFSYALPRLKEYARKVEKKLKETSIPYLP